MAAVATDDAALVEAFRERSRLESTRYHIARFVRRKPLGAFGAAVLILLIVTALLADVIAPCGDTEQGVGPPLADPSLDHLVGTDQFGRDLFTRLVFGARISLQVAVGATVFSIVPATMPGMTSAFFRGTFDYVAQRFVDAVQAMPALILLIAIVVILGAGVLNVVLALSIRSAIVNSRVMRGATLQVANRDYVTAASADPAAAHPAKHRGADDHRRLARLRTVPPRGGGAELPRLRGAGAGAVVGRDAVRRRTILHVLRAAHVRRAGGGAQPRGVRREHVRRRAARRPGPEAAGRRHEQLATRRTAAS